MNKTILAFGASMALIASQAFAASAVVSSNGNAVGSNLKGEVTSSIVTNSGLTEASPVTSTERPVKLTEPKIVKATPAKVTSAKTAAKKASAKKTVKKKVEAKKQTSIQTNTTIIQPIAPDFQ